MIYLALLLALAITIYFYWHSKPEISKARRYSLGILRFIALAIALLLLTNPVINYERSKEIKQRQIILLDNSASMQEKNEKEIKLDIAKSIADNLRENLELKNYTTETFGFSSKIDGDGNSSRLSTALKQLQQRDLLRNTDSVFLISDGWLDDSDPDFLNNFQIPINTLNFDFEATGFDLEVSKLKYNQQAWLKEITSIIVETKAEDFKETATLEFYLSDKLIESKELSFLETKYQQSIFEYEFTEAGLQEFYFTVKTDSLNEINEANNSQPGAILVQPDKTGIKIISDNMSWEGRYLIQSILKNERFEAEYLLKKNRLMKKNIPVNLTSELVNTKVLCLINNGKLHFNNAEVSLITSFTEQGGGILWFGEPVKELRNILPAKESRLSRSFKGQFLLTESAENYQSFDIVKQNNEEIPPVRFKYTVPLAGSTVIAEFQEEENPPAIIFQEIKLGKVLQFSFLDIYKWQLWGDNNHYLDFTNQILQWLSSPISESFYVWSSQNSYLLGENVKLTLTALDEKFAPITDLKAELIISHDGNDYINDFMIRNNDTYSYSFIAEQPGKYNVAISSGEKTATTNFVISPSNAESRDRGINNSLLAFIADKTGGKFGNIDNISNDIQVAETISQTNRYEIPIYKKWYTVALFLLAFSLEIFFRKRWGLL